MAFELDKAFTTEVKDRFHKALQQNGGKIWGTINANADMSIRGKAMDYGIILPRSYDGTGHASGSRRGVGNTVYTDSQYKKVRLEIRHFEDAELFDDEDTVRALADPKNMVRDRMTNKLALDRDVNILRKIYGDRTVVAADDTTSVEALPTEQVIDKDVGGVDSGLNLAKLKLIREKLAESSVFVPWQAKLVLTPKDISALLEEAEATSSDFVGQIYSLQNGQIAGLMGLTFVEVETSFMRIVTGATGQTDSPDLIIAYNDASLVKGTPEGMGAVANVNVLPSERHQTQLFAKYSASIARLDNEGVVVVQNVNEVTP